MKSVIFFVFVSISYASASGYGQETLLAPLNSGCLNDLCGLHDYKEKHYAPYQFGYAFHDDHYRSQQSREEVADGQGGVKGSYSFVDGNGIKRIVEYVADKGGFRAIIKTNEPGTKTSNPADAIYLSSAPQVLFNGDAYLGKASNIYAINSSPILAIESNKYLHGN